MRTAPQAGQRTTAPGACTYTSTRPTALTAPQAAQVVSAAVISMVKISRSRPPIAFPSSFLSSTPAAINSTFGLSESTSTSCRPESLGLDPTRLVVHPDQQRSGRLHERRGPADEHRRPRRARPRDLSQHRRVEPPRETVPARRLLASQRVEHLQAVAGGGQPPQLLAIDDVAEGAGRKKQPRRAFGRCW